MTPEEYKSLRSSVGSQANVAKMLGVSRPTVQKKENGTLKISEEDASALRALISNEETEGGGLYGDEPGKDHPSDGSSSEEAKSPPPQDAPVPKSEPKEKSDGKSEKFPDPVIPEGMEPYGEPIHGDDPVDPKHVPPLEGPGVDYDDVPVPMGLGIAFTRIAIAMERIATALEGQIVTGAAVARSTITESPVAEQLRETISELVEGKDHSAVNSALEVLGFEEPPATYSEVNKRAKELLVRHGVDTPGFNKIQSARDRLFNEFFSEDNE